MRKIFIILSFLICFDSFGQHGAGYITYDTTFSLGYAGITMRARVTRPTDYFYNYPDSLQLIAFVPGQGQMGTSYNTLDDYGPHYWLANGWNGGITLANGTHYPLLITLISSKTYHTGYEQYLAMNLLYAKFHPKVKARHWGGLSQGAFAISASLLYEASTGSEDGMKLISSALLLQGQSNEVTISNYPNRARWGQWAKKYGGKGFCLEGTNDDRQTWLFRNAMEDSIAGKCYFAYENIGGGSHCCWNTMVDPSRTNWKSTGSPLGANITTGGFPPNPNSMGTYQDGWNLFQWQLRQGDTTLITSGGAPNEAPSANAGTDQSITLPTSSVTLSGSGTDTDGSITAYAWTKISGGAATIVSASSASTSVTGLVEGTYTFRLTVTDDDSETGYDDVQVVVSPEQIAPGNSGTTYTWDNTLTNIRINDTYFGTALTRNDTVFIPYRAGGYRSFYISGITSDSVGGYVVIQFDETAFITPSGSNLNANFIKGCSGVKIDNFSMNNHIDIGWRLDSAYSNYIWINNASFIASPGVGNAYSITFPSYDGTQAKTFHHWKFTNCVFDGLYANNDGGVAIEVGKLRSDGVWTDVEISGCTFSDYKSDNDLPSNFIKAVSTFPITITNNRFINLGVVDYPTGHAAVINITASLAYIYQNYFEDNFGNGVRGNFADLPGLGANYTGTSRIYNNLSVRNRKYSFIEPRRTTAEDSTIYSGYVRPRRMPDFMNNTMYRPGVGAGGNDPYISGLVDAYGTDSLIMKNNLLMGVLDTTWNTAAYGPKIYSASVGSIAYYDTSGNRNLVSNSATLLRDTLFFRVAVGGYLYNAGSSVSYITDDYYGSPRLTNDIGAVIAQIITERIKLNPRRGRRIKF